MQKVTNVNKIAIVSIKGNSYRSRFSYMGKDKASCLMKQSDLNEKSKYVDDW